MIKTIEGETISFHESKKEVFSWHEGICVLIGYLAASFFIFTTPNALLPQVVGLSILMVIILGIFSSMAVFAILIPTRFVPSHKKIWVIFTRDNKIKINQTTPEADQLAICKAAKELEKKAWEYANHQRELKRIAENCK